jgi:hypothetical protein
MTTDLLQAAIERTDGKCGEFEAQQLAVGSRWRIA